METRLSSCLRRRAWERAFTRVAAGVIRRGSPCRPWVGPFLSCPSTSKVSEGLCGPSHPTPEDQTSGTGVRTLPTQSSLALHMHAGSTFASFNPAFTSSSVRELMPIVALDGRPIGSGSPGEAAITVNYRGLVGAVRLIVPRDAGTKFARPPVSNRIDELVWTKLEVLNTSKGQQGDNTGTVDFIAHYIVNDKHKGTIDVQEADTTIQTKIGEWVQIGGIDTGGNSKDSGILSTSRNSSDKQSAIYVKVELE